MEIGTPEGIALTRQLMRHVVGIYFDLQRGDDRLQFIYTATIFSVEDRWLIMTAGHNITEIAEARRRGWEIGRCLLVDSLGEGAQFGNQIPLPYDDVHPLHLGTDPSIDYGWVVPTVNTCRLLAANRITPFTEVAWANDPPVGCEYYLLGFPGKTNVYRGNWITVNASMFRLRRYAERPDDFPETNVQLFFYGRVIENPLGSVAGCSGGPIVSVVGPDAEGNVTYNLVALQSTQMGQDIKGMLMRPLGQPFGDVITGRQALLATTPQ